MPTFDLTWQDAAGTTDLGEPGRAGLPAPWSIVAASWMEALALAVDALALDPTAADGVACDLGDDDSVLVTLPGHGGRLRLVERPPPPSEPPSLTPRAVMRSSADLRALEPPSPTDAAAFARSPAGAMTTHGALDAVVRALAAAPTAEACGVVLGELMKHVPAESGAVLLAEERTGTLVFDCAFGPRADAVRKTVIPASAGIAGLVMRTGRTIHVRAGEQAPVWRDVDARSGYRTDAVLAVPIPSHERPRGVVELLNPFGRVPFTDAQVTLVQASAVRLAGRLMAGGLGR